MQGKSDQVRHYAFPRLALVACLTLVPGLWTKALAFPSLVKHGEYLIERTQTSISPSFPGAALKRINQAETVELVRDELVAAASLTPQGAIVPYSAAEDRCAQILAQDASLLACSPNFVKYLAAIPNDPLFTRSWAFDEAAVVNLHAAQGWEIELGDPSVVVAVLDTGVDYNHPDLRENIWRNPWEIPNNALDDDGNGYVDDIYGISVDPKNPNPMDKLGHGTHVAGIIAARSGNSLGSVGVAPGVKILPVRFIDENLGTIFDLVKGMNYILDLKARGVNIVAINASFGAADFALPEFNAIKRARDAGILLIAAAGNESVNNDLVPSYPANYALENIISVAALNKYGKLSQFSNYGPTTVHISAPGEDILSSVPGGGYESFDGTSAAVPFVSGAIALLKSSEPSLDYQSLRSRVLEYASRISSLNGKIAGAGFLNLYAILAKVPPALVDFGSAAEQERGTQIELFAGDTQTGRRRVSKGHPVLIVMQRSNSPAVFSDVSVELSFAGHLCPISFGTSIGDELAILTTRLPSAWNNLRTTFTVRNGAGIVTSSDFVKFVELPRKTSLQKRKSKLRARSSRAISRICSEFVRNTRIA